MKRKAGAVEKEPVSASAAAPLAVSIADAARMVGIGRATLWARLADGEGPKTFMLGRRRLVRVDSLNAWLASLEKATE